MLRPFRVAATELQWQKSDCETILSTHRAVCPRSSDRDARVDISEAITLPLGDWRPVR